MQLLVFIYMSSVCSLDPSPFVHREVHDMLHTGKKKEEPGIHCLRIFIEFHETVNYTGRTFQDIFNMINGRGGL